MTPRRKILLASSALLVFAAVLAVAKVESQLRPQFLLGDRSTNAAPELPQISLGSDTTDAILEQHLNQYVECDGVLDLRHKIGPTMSCGTSWLLVEGRTIEISSPGNCTIRGKLRAWDVAPPKAGEPVSASLSPGRYYRLENADRVSR